VHHSLDPILLDLVLLFAVCIAVVLVCRRLEMPPVVGFLVTGALVGPSSLGLVKNTELVEYLAEVGVIVLLFTVGMELSLRKLLLMRRAILLTGGIQVLGTTVLGAGVALVAGLGLGQAILLGFVLTLSSTAAVTKLLGDRGEISRPSGRIAVSMCVAQDLAVIGMILVVPLLGGQGKPVGETLLGVARSFGWLGLIAVAATIVIPWVLGLVSRARSHELFVLAVITLCLAVSVATARIGASLALGAFLAGLVLAGSDYRHQAVSEVEPFRDALGSLFFVSIGMLFDFRIILADPLVVGLSLAAVIVGKTGVAFLAAKCLRLPFWVAARAALMIAQVGEFSFVLLEVAGKGFLPETLQKTFLVVAVLSISVTPVLFWLGRSLSRHAHKADAREASERDDLHSHAIIIGFGPLGQTLAELFKSLAIPYQIIEMNVSTVRHYKSLGEPIHLGDASRMAILQAAGISSARLLVLVASDPDATQRTAVLARRLAPNLRIIARAIFLSDVPHLQSAGIEEVVAQELETATEMAARAMRHFLIPDAEVRHQIRHIRDQGYGIEQVAPEHDAMSTDVSDFIPDLRVQIFKIGLGSEIAGQSIAETDLRSRVGINLIAIQREGKSILQLEPDLVLQEDDIVVAIGSPDALELAYSLFDEESEEALEAVDA